MLALQGIQSTALNKERFWSRELGYASPYLSLLLPCLARLLGVRPIPVDTMHHTLSRPEMLGGYENLLKTCKAKGFSDEAQRALNSEDSSVGSLEMKTFSSDSSHSRSHD